MKNIILTILKSPKLLLKLINGNGRISEIMRFGIVGGISTLVQYGVYVVFVDAVNVPAVISTIISYAISFIGNFFMSSYFTFHSKPNAKKGLGFSLSHLVNMGMQVGLVAIFSLFIDKTFALLPAMAICIPLNYLMVRFAFTNRRFKSDSEKMCCHSKEDFMAELSREIEEAHEP